MKSKLLIVLVFFLAIFSESCTKENLDNNPDLFIGDWQTERIEFNGKELPSPIVHLSLETKSLYFKSYVGGNWDVADNKLTLTPLDDLNMPPYNYKVISVSETSLTLEVELTEVDYLHNFEEFEKDEIIRITEYYKRIE